MKYHKASLCLMPVVVLSLLLAACGTVSPLPPTAHFDESSGLLTVDCVLRIGDAVEVPPAFRFSAQRHTAPGDSPGSERVLYTLDSNGPVPTADADLACPNRAYYRPYAAPGTTFLTMILPDVISSTGEHYALELLNGDRDGTAELAEWGKRIYGDASLDVTVTAGATVSIPLPAAYADSSTVYVAHGTGRHHPEVTQSDVPGTLDITGVGPGVFDLIAVSDEGLNVSHEERMVITVCTDTSDLDDCNSDPEDCDCPATDQRLSAELAIREALFRYQIAGGAEAGIVRSNKYCLQIEMERSFSDAQGKATNPPRFNWHRTYLDPPDELMEHFAAAGNVATASQCARRNFRGVFDLRSGEPAVILVSGAITWQGDNRVVMEGGYYANGLSGAGEIVTLDLIEGKWQVVQTTAAWRS